MAQKVKMEGVPRELERAGSLGLAFANTVMPERDTWRRKPVVAPALRLDSYDEILEWAQRMGVLTAAECDGLTRLAAERPEEAARVVARARELRPALMRFFTAVALAEEPKAADLGIINSALRVRKVARGPRGFRWTEAEDPEALDRVLALVAQSAADLLTSEKLAKVRQCAAGECCRLFVYQSSTRLWCDMNMCGNRLKSQRYHRRHKR